MSRQDAIAAWVAAALADAPPVPDRVFEAVRKRLTPAAKKPTKRSTAA